MSFGLRARSPFSLILVASAALVAIAPGCSSSTQSTPQAGIVWVVQSGNNAGGLCPVAGEDSWTIGGGGKDDTTVGDQGTTGNGIPVGVSCTVSGSDSAGYNVFATATYGSNIGALTIQGHVDGTKKAQENINGQFNDNLGMIANLTEANCTITYPDQNMGVAPGRIWAHIDCPMAIDANRGRTCDANADFRFENCGQ